MRYQVGGSLHSDDPTYVTRQADEQLYVGLTTGNFCYILNSRQMGKSSLLQRTSYRLKEEGHKCVYLDMTRLGSEDTTPEQWYKGVIISLFYGLDLAEQLSFKAWWEQQAGLSSVQRLHQFVEEVLLVKISSKRIFIFIDEIDSLLSLKFPVNDFFAWIRHCYNQQAYDPNFKRLGFAIFGVASPSDLITDKYRTPFNIGRSIKLYGFCWQEAQPLLNGLSQVVSQPETVLEKIIYWTGGQPFLTQKLCQIVYQTASEIGKVVLPPGTEGFWVEQLVRSHILQSWQSQDEPVHLRTIRDRLLVNEQRAGRLLGLYQQVLQAEAIDIHSSSVKPVLTDDSREQIELLLSGLVEVQNGCLRIKNPIYRHVFNEEWVIEQLDKLRPYSQTLNAWIASDYQDESRLLRGKALQEVLEWTQNKSLSDVDYQFLAASQELERREVQQRLETERLKEVEARLASERKNARRMKWLLTGMTIKFILAAILGVIAFISYRQASVSEVEAIVAASNGSFESNHRLEALVQSIQARRKYQRLNFLEITQKNNLELQTRKALERAVYGADEYNRLSGHEAAVLSVDVSPDSSLIASAGLDRTIKLWRRDGTEVATLKGHKTIVRLVNFSPDGKMLICASDDGIIKLWKQDIGGDYRLLKSFQAHASAIWGLAISKDGQTIASASFDKTVKLWKSDGTLLNTFQSYSRAFRGVAFSQDGQTLAVGSFDNTIRLWKREGTSWQTAKPLQTLQGHLGWLSGVAFSPDGQTIASSSEDTTIKLWRRDREGKYRLSKTLQGHNAGVLALAFSRDGRTIASASSDKTIVLWHSDGTQLRTLRGHSASIWGLAFSPDDSFIASAGAENVVRLWQSENPFQKTIIAHKAGMYSIDISSDSSTIATAGHENMAKLWNRQGQLLKSLYKSQNNSSVFDVSFSGDGKLIALTSNDDTVTLWRRNGTLVDTYINPSSALIAGNLSPDGQTIATSSTDKSVKIWTRNQSVPKTLKGHQAEIWQVAFSPNGQLVASASSDGTVKLWTLAGKLFKTFKGHTAAVWRVTFSPNGQMIASGSGDKTVKLWTLDGKLFKTLKGHTAAVWGVAFSPDNQIVASGSVDTTIKLWNLDGKELTTLTGHTAAIRGLAISPDGRFMASIGDDNRLILWNLTNISHLDALTHGCSLIRDYLKTNTAIKKSNRSICQNLFFEIK